MESRLELPQWAAAQTTAGRVAEWVSARLRVASRLRSTSSSRQHSASLLLDEGQGRGRLMLRCNGASGVAGASESAAGGLHVANGWPRRAVRSVCSRLCTIYGCAVCAPQEHCYIDYSFLNSVHGHHRAVKRPRLLAGSPDQLRICARCALLERHCCLANLRRC
jgi:hypothetical protein